MYFSEQERGTKPRVITGISHEIWSGLVSHIECLINKGYFAENFPEYCSDFESAVYTTNKAAFSSNLRVKIPEIEYPFLIEKK